MTVGELMTPNPKTLGPQMLVSQALEIMRTADVNAMPVVDTRGSLVGMITDREVAIDAAGQPHPDNTKVEQCMTQNVNTIARDTTLEQAKRLMTTHEVHRLPVVENGRLIGMLSEDDIPNSANVSQEVPREATEMSTGVTST